MIAHRYPLVNIYSTFDYMHFRVATFSRYKLCLSSLPVQFEIVFSHVTRDSTCWILSRGIVSGVNRNCNMTMECKSFPARPVIVISIAHWSHRTHNAFVSIANGWPYWAMLGEQLFSIFFSLSFLHRATFFFYKIIPWQLFEFPCWVSLHGASLTFLLHNVFVFFYIIFCFFSVMFRWFSLLLSMLCEAYSFIRSFALNWIGTHLVRNVRMEIAVHLVCRSNNMNSHAIERLSHICYCSFDWTDTRMANQK